MTLTWASVRECSPRSERRPRTNTIYRFRKLPGYRLGRSANGLGLCVNKAGASVTDYGSPSGRLRSGWPYDERDTHAYDRYGLFSLVGENPAGSAPSCHHSRRTTHFHRRATACYGGGGRCRRVDGHLSRAARSSGSSSTGISLRPHLSSGSSSTGISLGPCRSSRPSRAPGTVRSLGAGQTGSALTCRPLCAFELLEHARLDLLGRSDQVVARGNARSRQRHEQRQASDDHRWRRPPEWFAHLYPPHSITSAHLQVAPPLSKTLLAKRGSALADHDQKPVRLRQRRTAPR